jgi:hypothetical protein
VPDMLFVLSKMNKKITIFCEGDKFTARLRKMEVSVDLETLQRHISTFKKNTKLLRKTKNII